MKKILLGFIAIGLFTFVGCDKEDEDKNNESNSENNTNSGEAKTCQEIEFTWNDVTNPTTGRTWMDRNLGASQVATSSSDENAYGDLYQWGRGSDGHQCRGSEITDPTWEEEKNSLSSGDTPGHGDFITLNINAFEVWDWRNPQNDSLWQGVDGINNPCPTGYRLPTKTEWEEEVESWTSEDANGAFGSVLRLPMAGERLVSDGILITVGAAGKFWSGTVSGTDARHLYVFSSDAGMSTNRRSYGLSVRCIKD